MNINDWPVFLGIVVLFGVQLYSIRNLMLQVEKLEDITQNQSEYISTISTIITEAKSQLQELDSTGHFIADDELGVFFNKMKSIQSVLDNFIIQNGKEEIR